MLVDRVLIEDIVQVSGLDKIALAAVFEELLKTPKAFDVHFVALVGMRIFAEQQIPLTVEQGKVMLASTDRIALQAGIDEWYKTMKVLSYAPETAQALLAFTEEQLLGGQDIPEWLWLSFWAVSMVVQSGIAPVPQTLQAKLLQEIDLESDAATKLLMLSFFDGVSGMENV